MKIKNIVGIALAILLLIGTFAQFALADEDCRGAICLTSVWRANNGNRIDVNQGETPLLVVDVMSNADFELSIDVLQDGRVVRRIINDLPVDADLDNPYFGIWNIPTGEINNLPALAGDYVINVHVQSFRGEDSTLLGMHVEAPLPPVNHAPVLVPIGDQEVDENTPLSFQINGNDADGDALSFSAANLPQGAVFNAATRTFSWTPGEHDADTDYEVTFAVSDGELTDEETVTIIVRDVSIIPPVNHAPVLAPIGDKEVDENTPLSFQINGNDADGDALSFSAANLPQGAVFNAATRTFSWTPGEHDADTDYEVTFAVSDGELNDEETITITVRDVSLIVNNPPVIDEIKDRFVRENAILKVPINAEDIEGDRLVIRSYVKSGVLEDLGNIELRNDADGSVYLSIYPGYDFVQHPLRSRNFQVLITVSDGHGVPVREIFQVTVTDVNRAPVMDAIGDKEAVEGEEITFVVTAADADGDNLIYNIENIPVNAVFNTETGEFSWIPSYEQSGVYELTFGVTDSRLADELTDEETIIITVGNINRAPVLDPIGNHDIEEMHELTFTVTASDADDDALLFSADGLPEGAEFNPETRIFTWTPGDHEALTEYPIRFKVSDGLQTDEELILIKVHDINQAPVMDAIGDKEAVEGEELAFTITATDDDGDALTFSVANLPVGAVFDSATAAFVWTPSFEQAGNYNVTFTVSDGVLSDSETITISVMGVNLAPILNPISNKAVNENELLTFIVTATDSDGDALLFSAEGLPAGATFDSADGTFVWTPGYEQSGAYELTFRVTDGSQTDEETIIITVGNINRELHIISRPVTSGREGELYIYQIIAVDPDNDELAYSLLHAPEGMTIDEDGLVQWIPEDDDDTIVELTVSDGEITVMQRYKIVISSLYNNVKIATAKVMQEVIYPGEYISLLINLKNNGNEDFEDLKITVMAYDLNMRQSSREFDLDRGESESRAVHLWVPYDIEPGTYLIEVTVGNSHFHDTTYRQVTVI